MLKETKYNQDVLECVFCGKDFQMNEIFICHMKDDGMVTIAECLNCSPLHKNGTVPESDGGWYIVERNLKGYECKPLNR